jgi:beta-glucosidase
MESAITMKMEFTPSGRHLKSPTRECTKIRQKWKRDVNKTVKTYIKVKAIKGSTSWKNWNRVNHQPNLPLYQGRDRVTAGREHLAISMNAAKEGMVLLKNDGNLLPLKKGARVALFGKGTFDYVKGGGGSGDVTVSHIINIYDGLKQYPDMVTVYEKSAAFYKDYVEKEYKSGNAPGMIEEPVLPDEILDTAKNYADIAIISISRFSGEAWDRKLEGVQCRNSRKEDWVTPMQDRADVLFPRGDFYLTDKENRNGRKGQKSLFQSGGSSECRRSS